MGHITDTRIGESTTTTGTGNIALDGALTAHKTFSSVMSNTDTCFYDIAAVDGNGAETGDWEEGLGTYNTGNTLSRTTVLRSSNSNNAVSFSAGTKYVRLVAERRQVAAAPRGGSAGQALTKVDNTDYNTQWSTVATDAASVTNTPAGNIAATDVQAALNELDSEKQATLVSATNIKTINSNSLLGAGDLVISASPAGAGTEIQYRNAGAFGASGATTDATGNITVPSGAKLHLNAADQVVAADFGGTTASFPALRRNGAALETVLADLSLFADFKAQKITSAGSAGAHYFIGTTAMLGVAGGVTSILNVGNTDYLDLKLRNLLAGGGNGSYVQTPSMTVGNLAAAATAGAGARAFVTDATATTFLSTVAGGGANKVPVVSDGTNWLIG